MSRFSSLWKRPYPVERTPGRKWIVVCGLSAFVYFFLLVFQPFGLGEAGVNLPVILIGYALATAIPTALMEFAIPPLFPRFFREEHWNFDREIFVTSLVVLCVALLNYLYSVWMHFIPLHWMGIVWFFIFTAAVGILPVAALSMQRMARLEMHYTRELDSMNQQISSGRDVPSGVTEVREEAGGESMQFAFSDLVYVKAEDNYISLFLISQPDKPVMLRKSLTALESEWSGHSEMFRCHRSYLVNLKQVEKVKGNAQGYKLLLKDCPEEIPVGRSKSDEMKERLRNLRPHSG